MNENLALALINSRWHKNYENHEILFDQNWVSERLFLPHQKSISLTEEEVQSLLDLRDMLLDCLTKKPTKAQLSALDERLKKNSYYPQMDIVDSDYKIKWIPTGSAFDTLISRIILAFYDLLEKDIFQNIKTCENELCHYSFIDHSKNQSKKFCSTRCNNYVKVKRFRSKNE
ncbi:MAG: CGNR zinc finger domain-containing protein [Clostridia bacterium]|nr:CGNR zinc finger domain-containing protein [Clostridia bacterium]